MTMRAHKFKITVPRSHEIVVRLPDDFPQGEADVFVVPTFIASPKTNIDVAAGIKAWIASLPPAPVVPLAALDRSELYR